MSTAAIVVIVVAAVIVIAMLFAAIRVRERHRSDARRQEAGALRERAQDHMMRAEQERAAADRQAGRARKAQAGPTSRPPSRGPRACTRSSARTPRRGSAILANEHMERARAVDPDADDSFADREAEENETSASALRESPRESPRDGDPVPAAGRPPRGSRAA